MRYLEQYLYYRECVLNFFGVDDLCAYYISFHDHTDRLWTSFINGQHYILAQAFENERRPFLFDIHEGCEGHILSEQTRPFAELYPRVNLFVHARQTQHSKFRIYEQRNYTMFMDIHSRRRMVVADGLIFRNEFRCDSLEELYQSIHERRDLRIDYERIHS